LKKLSKNTLVFVVTHDTESCKLYADRMLGLKDGKIDYDKIINSENLCRKSDNIEILTKSQHIPNKVSISIAYSNFKTRILRSMISILLFCTALISLTCTMSLFFYSTNDGVYLTAKNNQAEYLHFYNTELDRYGNATKSFTYLNRLYVENISSNTLFEMIPNRGNKALILGGTSKYALNNKIEVDSVNDLIAYGLKFHDDYFLEFNDDRVVINDFSFQIMKDETRQFFENIYIPQYIFYLVENGSEIPLYLSSYDYGDMVGKEIKVYSPIDEDNQLFMDSFEVSGIYITNYLDYVDANFDLRHNLTDDEMNNWIMMWNHVYKTYVSKGYSDLHRYLPGTFYAEETNLISLDSTQFNLRNYTLQIENSTNLYENNISIGMFDYISNRYFILGNDDIITTEYELKNDEIFINLDIYNILNNTSYQPIDFIENGSIISYPNLDGMNMSIKIQDRDLSRQVYEKNYKIIGVFIDEDEQYSADSIWMSVYVNDLNANDLTKIYLTVYSVISVYVGNDYANLPKLIKEFSDEGMLPDFDYSNSFYALESGIRQAQTLMLIISIASLVTAIIMITNVISVSINSKKKEIGILRAIGYSGGHVSAIFLYESILLGFITLIIVLGLQPVIVKILNLVIAKADYQYVKFFSVEIITGLILFTITILIPVVSTVYPIYRISKLKPAECIRKVE
ncbi:MAG: FtsX-like permease family protein, partial [Firmicutes bacterium]|nr:FtsX-like permease family protein [Bacillota bacterium]